MSTPPADAPVETGPASGGGAKGLASEIWEQAGWVPVALGVLAIVVLAVFLIASSGGSEGDRASDDSVPTTTSTIDPEVLSASACADDLNNIIAASFDTNSGLPDTTYITRVYGLEDPRTAVMTQVAIGIYSDQSRIGTQRAVEEGIGEIFDWCDRNAQDAGY